MTDREQAWEAERARVERLASAALAELGRDAGDIDAFALLLLSFAVQMNVQIHGPAQLDAALADIARRELIRHGQAAQC